MLSNDIEKFSFYDIEKSLKLVWSEMDKEEQGLLSMLLLKIADEAYDETIVVLDLLEDPEVYGMGHFEQEKINVEVLREKLHHIAQTVEIEHTDPEDSEVWLDCQLILGMCCEDNKIKISYEKSIANTIRDAFGRGWTINNLN